MTAHLQRSASSPAIADRFDGRPHTHCRPSTAHQQRPLQQVRPLQQREFDPAGETLLDPSGENDWLVPYERGSIYTGDLLISAHYGILEEASWDEAGDAPFALADLVQEYQGIETGF